MHERPLPFIYALSDVKRRAASEQISQVTSFTLVGVEARTVTVEVSVTNGYPRTMIVGMPNLSVRESRERVEAAIKASRLAFPDRRITINLSPAELPKEGANFDLPVAVGIIAEEKGIHRDALGGWAIAGELSLDGSVHPVRGVLAMAMKVASTLGPRRRLMVPRANAAEAEIVDGVDVVPVASLREAIEAINGKPRSRSDAASDRSRGADPSVPGSGSSCAATAAEVDLAEVRGQPAARRALEVAVAGGHNILLIGTPGGGKTLLAQRIPGILPPMSRQESLEATLVYSAAGRVPTGGGLLGVRPFRAPHSSISAVGLVGGGPRPAPGEVSLAHHGVLFLDELPEFAPGTLNLLRQPLEEGRVTIVRAHGSASFPARFVLVAAMNPCPCGYLGDSRRACRCPPTRLRQYRARISGPLLDRIDLHIEVPRVSLDAIAGDKDGESSESVRGRVIAAREMQTERFAVEPGIHCNAQMGLRLLRRHAASDARGRALLRMAAERLGLSGRAYHRILRVARTIADLDGAAQVGEKHIAEAVGYRALDRAGVEG
jgi:magnesium chelatase family protein